MSLDTTIGGSSANSYVTLTEAANYLADRVGYESWSNGNYSDAQKEAALKDATQMLDQFAWLGDAVTGTQALQFPRYRIYKRTGWLWYSSEEIPQEVKDAQCLLGFELLTNPSAYRESELEQYSSIGIGNGELQLTLRSGASSASRMPVQAMRIVQFLIASTQSPLRRG